MMEKQKEAFLGGEGDAWFLRNREALHADTPVRALPIEMLAALLATGDPVLEIGCAEGANLAALVQRSGAQGYGIDPSSAAIEAGRALHPELTLQPGTADQLPYPDEKFKLVWFGFCLYLVDRSRLMQAVAEADRVLAEGGFLAITDFDPPRPCRRPYHHRPGLFSWKMDYSQLFLANPAYTLVTKRSYSHGETRFHPDPGERIATWLLHKSLATAYPDEERCR